MNDKWIEEIGKLIRLSKSLISGEHTDLDAATTADYTDTLIQLLDMFVQHKETLLPANALLVCPI